MRILLTNDDGYKAAGIHALARALAPFGELTVVAPKYHQSGMSAAVSLGEKRLVAKDLPDERPGNWSYLDGTPASCVKFGLEYKYENRNPDLVVCGINHGSNASAAANYSGTLGAAAEAAINGRKSVGVSLCDYRPDADFSTVERLLPPLLKKLLDNWPEGHYGLYYNINFPSLPASEIKGVKVTRQGVGYWVREFEPWITETKPVHGREKDFLWERMADDLEEGEKAYYMAGEFIDGETESSNADHRLNDEGWITITPCNINLTDLQELQRLQELDF